VTANVRQTATGRVVLSIPEQKVISLLRRAEVQDRSVKVGTRTRYTAETWAVNSRVAANLVVLGFARFSRPAGKFLLITEAGRDREAAMA
jgi:hypothetical protein